MYSLGPSPLGPGSLCARAMGRGNTTPVLLYDFRTRCPTSSPRSIDVNVLFSELQKGGQRGTTLANLDIHSCVDNGESNHI